MSTATKLITAEDLLRMPEDGSRYELLEGELHRMPPTGSEHGAVAIEVGWRLAQYISEHQMGRVFAAETGFLIGRNPDTVRAPDVAFVSKEQVDRCGIPKSFFPEAPVLAVEVVSPKDTAEYVDAKVRMWLAAGTNEVWVVFPQGRTTTVYRSLDDIQVLTEGDTLSGGTVMPGFTCPVADLFRGIK